MSGAALITVRARRSMYSLICVVSPPTSISRCALSAMMLPAVDDALPTLTRLGPWEWREIA